MRDIAQANTDLATALATPATQHDFHLALRQRRVSHRGLAILMRFHAQHPTLRSALGSRSTTIALPSNPAVADYLGIQLARLTGTGTGLPNYQRSIQADITALKSVPNRQISVLDLAVMVDNCGVRPAGFLHAWQNAFAPHATVQDAFDRWADYLNWWNGHYRYLCDLLDTGDCVKDSLRYKVALLKEAVLGRYWTAGGDSVEHSFAAGLHNPLLYGFSHPAAYQTFCQTLGNLVPLDQTLNLSLNNSPPYVKARHYISQKTISGVSVVPSVFTSATYSPSAFQLGTALLPLTNPKDQQDLIELRNLEMVCFAATVL